MSPLRVTALYQYPVKSCRGLALDSARVTPFGVEFDRHWMVVDEKGRFMSQRRLPKMALIEPEPGADGLTLRAPGQSDLHIANAAGREQAVRVWGHDDTAADAGDEAASWLSDYLDFPCRLVHPGSHFERPVDPDFDRHGSNVLFADGFPFLLISEASLDSLNSRLSQPVTMDRFRPNIVVAGCDPHGEDLWKTIRIGKLLFDAVKPCARCTIPTVDQATGMRGADNEPSATLATYRKFGDGQIYFGQNLIHHAKSGRIGVGDTVDLL